MRCHAKRQLDSMEAMGLGELGAATEWSTASDDQVCNLCAPLQGIVLTAKEARGLLPHHEGCRCCWTPANVGEDTEGQRRTRRQLTRQSTDPSEQRYSKRAIARRPSRRRSGWKGATVAIAENRPKSIF